LHFSHLNFSTFVSTFTNNNKFLAMKKVMILAASAVFMLATATVSFAGDQNAKCDKDKKACCKNASGKACAKGAEAKSCHKDEKSESKEKTK
jgi:hypothetical protein